MRLCWQVRCKRCTAERETQSEKKVSILAAWQAMHGTLRLRLPMLRALTLRLPRSGDSRSEQLALQAHSGTDSITVFARSFFWLLSPGAALLTGCFSLLARLPEPTTVDQRIAAFPAADCRCSNQSPSLERGFGAVYRGAERSRRGAGLGIGARICALGQMELLRRVARGELAMGAGPIATDIDRALRILDLGRAAPAMYQRMDPQGKAWLRPTARASISPWPSNSSSTLITRSSIGCCAIRSSPGRRSMS